MRVICRRVPFLLLSLCFSVSSFLPWRGLISASVVFALATSLNTSAQASSSNLPDNPSQTTSAAQTTNAAPQDSPALNATNGQTGPSSPPKKTEMNAIGAISTVKDNIVVSAGLLTQQSATQLFGGWVAEHFLVVQVTVGNQSREQQFVLHDIFLDYSNWKLSGIYGTQATPTSDDSHPLQDYQSGTQQGQISSIGALEIQEALKQNSVFSKRNFFVNGLVLIGASAGGFTFLGPEGFTQGVAGYSSAFLPALQKFWPDRRIDQQSNVLKYGFQDKMVIAKEDPG